MIATVAWKMWLRARVQSILALVLIFVSYQPVCASIRGLYVGDDFYVPGVSTQAAAKASGFNTFFLFTLHVYANGDLYYNGTLVAQNGNYVGNANWGSTLAALKTKPTGITRIEMVIGSWGDPSFTYIKNMIASQGTGSSSILYKNFQALKNATGIDAIQYDDEQTYDAPSAVAFGNMLAGLGLKVTLCPYTSRNFWGSVKSQLGANVDAIYLQCYDGGAGNNPATWISALGGFKVYPGLWGNTDTTGSVATKMRNWQTTLGIEGGFMWLNGGMPGDAPKWAQALFSGLDPLNGIFAQDSATNYAATGFTGNQGWGFGDWVLSTAGGGSYISGDVPRLFGLWNSAANGQSTASRTFNAVLLPGDSFSVKLQMGALDKTGNQNGFQFLDASGNVLFSYWHQQGDVANGYYSDASGTNTAIGFAYDLNLLDSFTFKLNGTTNYTFTDNTKSASLNGTLAPGASISKVTFFRKNGSTAPPNGQDFKFSSLSVTTAPDRPTLALSQGPGGWNTHFTAGRGFFTYHVQRATNLAGPWSNVGMVSQPVNGLGSFLDTNATAGQIFYRTVVP